MAGPLRSTEVFEAPSRRWANTPVHVTGIALLAVAAGLVVATVLEIAYDDPEVVPLLVSSGVAAGVGLVMWRRTRVPEDVRRMDAFLSGSW